jgi:hypothetical protein
VTGPDIAEVRSALARLLSVELQRQARAERARRRGPRLTGYCSVCGTPVWSAPLGRSRRYCSDSHRVIACRRRKAGRERAERLAA